MSFFEEKLDELKDTELPWEKLTNSTVMISGATGMVGTCLIEMLMRRNAAAGDNIRVIALSRNEESARYRLENYWKENKFQYVACDVNEKIPECGHVDYIIHAASNTHPLQYSQDSIGTITANVLGTKNLLDYAIAHGAKQFCFLSSVEIYGENRGDVELFREDYLGFLDCNTMRAGYPESKRLGEALCNAYFHTYKLDFVIPRLSRIYGPTMLLSDSKAISQFIKKAALGEEIILKSEGNQKYSYTFVSDAVAGILFAMLRGENTKAYNIADRESDITLKELAQYLAEIGHTSVIFDIPDEAERRGYSAATKALLDAAEIEKLGWHSKVHMREGLQCTVKAIQNAASRSSAGA